MSNLEKAINEILENKKWSFERPANIDYNFNGTITLAKGKDINVTKELGGQIAKTIEIYCAQNFTLKYGFNRIAGKTWPRTLVGGTWHKWNNRAYRTLRIEPAADASTQIIISAVDPKG